jgi:hypothetical protein
VQRAWRDTKQLGTQKALKKAPNADFGKKSETPRSPQVHEKTPLAISRQAAFSGGGGTVKKSS